MLAHLGCHVKDYHVNLDEVVESLNGGENHFRKISLGDHGLFRRFSGSLDPNPDLTENMAQINRFRENFNLTLERQETCTLGNFSKSSLLTASSLTFKENVSAKIIFHRFCIHFQTM